MPRVSRTPRREVCQWRCGVLTIPKAAARIDGLTEHRVRQMCKNGQLHCFMAGKKILINEEELYRAVPGRSGMSREEDEEDMEFELL